MRERGYLISWLLNWRLSYVAQLKSVPFRGCRSSTLQLLQTRILGKGYERALGLAVSGQENPELPSSKVTEK